MWSNRVTSTEKWKVSASKSCSPLGCSWTMVSLQSPQPWGHASEHQGSPPGSATLDAAWSSCTQGWRLHHAAYFFCTRHGCPTALLGPLKCHRVFCHHAPVSGGVATPGSPQKDIMWWVLTESCCWSEAEESPQCKQLFLSALPVTLRWLSWIHVQIHSFGAWGRHRGKFKMQRFKSCFC